MPPLSFSLPIRPVLHNFISRTLPSLQHQRHLHRPHPAPPEPGSTLRTMASPDPPPTKPLYQSHESLRRHITRITSLQALASLPQELQALFKTFPPATSLVLELEETIFYPQGGGQPFDTGKIVALGGQGAEGESGEGEGRGFEVAAVRNAGGGRVLHLGTWVAGDEGAGKGVQGFEQGDLVELQVDGGRRDLNSRVHTAGHVLGGAVRRLLAERFERGELTESKASHAPEAASVEFGGLIDGSWREAIERESCRIVEAERRVALFWYRPEELRRHPGIVLPDALPVVAGFGGLVRVVEIEGEGAYPCGGTHTPHTGLVGRVVVKGIKRQKGVSKVSYFVEERK